MQAEAHDKTLGCTACHDVHAFDTRRAAVESCLGCHDDGHSRSYKQSPHYRLWQAETEAKARKAAASPAPAAICRAWPRKTTDGRTFMWNTTKA